MAPEHLHGDTTDERADIYSLAAVLYELLTGKRPFDGQTAYDIAARALTAPLTPPSTYDPTIPAALDHVVLTALSREPNDRYPTMAEFALALRRAMSQQSAGESGGASYVTVPLSDPSWSSPQPVPPTALASRRISPYWLLAVLVVTVLLVISLAGVVFALRQGGRDARQTPGPSGAGPIAQVSPTDSNGLVSLQTPQPTAGPSSTPYVQATLTATSSAATPTITAGTATPTSVPAGPALTIAPTPLALTPNSPNHKTCAATQTVTNNTPDTVGWAWQQPGVPGFRFQIDGGPSVGWPTETVNVPPQGQNTLVVTTNCKPNPVSYTIVVNDSLGGQYTFTMTVQ